jgi:hypothetical protein
MKTIGLLLIGIILGSAGGYFGHQYLTQPRLDELEADVASLSVDLTQLQSDYEVLSTVSDFTEGQLDTLQEAYTDLEAENATLNEEQAELNQQFELLSDMYESLLEDYETNLGGLDFSNQTIPVIDRSYTWEYDGEEYTFDIAIPEPLYEYYSEKTRYRTQDYRGYIMHPYDDDYVRVLLSEFDRIIGLTELTEEDKVGLVRTFVQNMEYEQDSDTLEYPKFPVETLFDGGGDCEDTTILMGHLLKEMDVGTALIYMPGHMALAIEGNSTGIGWTLDNTTYYYQETTAKGWDPGDVPFSYKYTEYTLFPIEDEPYIAHTWDAVRKNEKVTITVTYTNDTPLNATGYRAWVGIELSDGYEFGKTGALIELDFKESKTTTLKIEGPRFQTMRLVVGVKAPDGSVQNKVYSEYFTTR